MESSNDFHYVADLKRHICHLEEILREWKRYVPQDVILRSQIPLETTPSHLLQPQISQTLSATQCRRHPLSGTSGSEETWKKPLRTFINRIPSVEKWPGTVLPPQVSVLNLLFQSETLLRDSDSPTSTIQYRHSDIIQTIGAFASLAQKCANDVKWAKYIVSYQKLLLGALCHIACCLGVDPKSVDKTMNLISKGGPDHLQELRHGAAWGVKAIDRLQTESNWDIRSGDILFYCQGSLSIIFIWSWPVSLVTPTFTSLRYWAKASQSISIFTTCLKEDQYTTHQESLHTNHLSVPCIIKCIFGRSVQYVYLTFLVALSANNQPLDSRTCAMLYTAILILLENHLQIGT